METPIFPGTWVRNPGVTFDISLSYPNLQCQMPKLCWHNFQDTFRLHLSSALPVPPWSKPSSCVPLNDCSNFTGLLFPALAPVSLFTTGILSKSIHVPPLLRWLPFWPRVKAIVLMVACKANWLFCYLSMDFLKISAVIFKIPNISFLFSEYSIFFKK